VDMVFGLKPVDRNKKTKLWVSGLGLRNKQAAEDTNGEKVIRESPGGEMSKKKVEGR